MVRNMLRKWFGGSASEQPERALIESLEGRSMLSAAALAIAAAPALAGPAPIIAAAVPNMKGTWSGYATALGQKVKVTVKVTAQRGSAVTGYATVLGRKSPSTTVRLSSSNTFAFKFNQIGINASISGKVVGKVLSGSFKGSMYLGSASGTFKLTKVA